ncbi:CPBP family intramembrane glutamic endopeptidase [Bacillaceae bacterium S4-13-56]
MDPNIVVDITPTFISWVIVIEGAIIEEITYRLGIQNFFASKFKFFRNNYWGAIIISSLLWTFAHANTIDPEWIKFAQIFPLGLALGYAFRKYGIEVCILVHALFNALMLMFGPGL